MVLKVFVKGRDASKSKKKKTTKMKNECKLEEEMVRN